VSYCLECEGVIEEEFDDVGEIVSCPECGIELEVISVDPVEFDLAPVDEEEDDSEDDEEFGLDESEDDDDEDWDEDDDAYDDEKDKEEY